MLQLRNSFVNTLSEDICGESGKWHFQACRRQKVLQRYRGRLTD